MPVTTVHGIGNGSMLHPRAALRPGAVSVARAGQRTRRDETHDDRQRALVNAAPVALRPVRRMRQRPSARASRRCRPVRPAPGLKRTSRKFAICPGGALWAGVSLYPGRIPTSGGRPKKPSLHEDDFQVVPTYHRSSRSLPSSGRSAFSKGGAVCAANRHSLPTRQV
jgi:hypothetical protein